MVIIAADLHVLLLVVAIVTPGAGMAAATVLRTNIHNVIQCTAEQDG